MNKHYFLLIAVGLILGGTANAQKTQDDQQRVARQEMMSGGLMSAPGLMTRAANTALKDSVIWFRSGVKNHKDTYSYTSAGKLEKHEQLSWNAETSDWEWTYTDDYTYDGQDRRASYKHTDRWGTSIENKYTWEGNVGAAERKYSSSTSEYTEDYDQVIRVLDDQGRTIKVSYFRPKKIVGGEIVEWLPSEEIINEYDESGNKTKWACTFYDEGSKSFSQEETYVYGDDFMHITTVSQDFVQNTTSTVESLRVKKEGNPVEWLIYYKNAETGNYPLSTDKYYEYYPYSESIVEDSGKGSFDLIADIPVDSIAECLIVVQLPQGFTLDRNRTKLVGEYDRFDLTFGTMVGEEDTWVLVLREKTKALKSASAQPQDSPVVLANIAYTVDATVEKGKYEMVVEDIQYTAPSGIVYHKPGVTVIAVVEGSATNTEKIQVSAAKVYSSGNNLIIDSPSAENIEIYSITGAKIYQGVKPAGEATVQVPVQPGQVIIIKGGSNWVQKVLTK